MSHSCKYTCDQLGVCQGKTPLATPIQAFANSLPNTFAESSFNPPDADGVIEFKEAK